MKNLFKTVKGWLEVAVVLIACWAVVFCIYAVFYAVPKTYNEQKEVAEKANTKAANFSNKCEYVQARLEKSEDARAQSDATIKRLETTLARLREEHTVDTKQEIRSFLERLNPDLLRGVDLGVSQLPIFIGPSSQSKLDALSLQTGFDRYLSFKRTASLLSGGGNQQAGWLNEQNEAGLMTGYILYPKDALRRGEVVAIGNPLKKRCLAFADSLDGLVANCDGKTNVIACVSEFTSKYENPYTSLRLAIEEAGIYNHSLDQLIDFNSLNRNFSDEVSGIAKKIRKVAERL